MYIYSFLYKLCASVLQYTHTHTHAYIYIYIQTHTRICVHVLHHDLGCAVLWPHLRGFWVDGQGANGVQDLGA